MNHKNLPKTDRVYKEWKNIEIAIFNIEKEVSNLIEKRNHLNTELNNKIEEYRLTRDTEADERGFKCPYCRDTGYTVSCYDGGYNITSCSCPKLDLKERPDEKNSNSI